mmetsp:Transcript_36856/g.104011  ORF Transcript_36856/g.104011 Transcript_36856/m.104011 type:complete len:243 (-) Transcript_36856:1544-2272(-)
MPFLFLGIFWQPLPLRHINVQTGRRSARRLGPCPCCCCCCRMVRGSRSVSEGESRLSLPHPEAKRRCGSCDPLLRELESALGGEARGRIGVNSAGGLLWEGRGGVPPHGFLGRRLWEGLGNGWWWAIMRSIDKWWLVGGRQQPVGWPPTNSRCQGPATAALHHLLAGCTAALPPPPHGFHELVNSAGLFSRRPPSARAPLPTGGPYPLSNPFPSLCITAELLRGSAAATHGCLPSVSQPCHA